MKYEKTFRKTLTGLSLATAFAVTPIWAQPVFDSGSDGSDGAFNPTVDEVFVVDQAEYNFTSINIPAGVTITFDADQNQNFPVVWLSQSDVTIAGTVDLSGSEGHPGANADFVQRSVGGPGGWSGGTGAVATVSDPDVSFRATAGHGPGGGREGVNDNTGGSGAGHRSAGNAGNSSSNSLVGRAYGNSFAVPLQGGSGGGGGAWTSGSGGTIGSGGGAGGGGILIASSTDIEVTPTGAVIADGGAGGGESTAGTEGGGGGSGGTIRLVSNSITVDGALSAAGGIGGSRDSPGLRGGDGSDGRIRLDAFDFNLNGTSNPVASTGVPVLLELPASSPRLAITDIGGNAVSSPTGVPENPDITIMSSDPVTVNISASNIPVGTTVNLLLFANNGSSAVSQTSALFGTLENSTASADVTFQAGITQIIAHATFNPTKELKAPNGEDVAKVEISTDLQGVQKVAWITESGKKVTPFQPKRW